jgi:hypothetical protein
LCGLANGCTTMPPPKTLIVIEGALHYFIRDWTNQHFPSQEGLIRNSFSFLLAIISTFFDFHAATF